MPELASPAQLWPAFAQEHVKPLVLRDFEQLPEFISGGDLDLSLKNPSELAAAERAIRTFAANSGLEIASLVRRSYVWELKLRGDFSSRQLIVDLHTEG